MQSRKVVLTKDLEPLPQNHHAVCLSTGADSNAHVVMFDFGNIQPFPGLRFTFKNIRYRIESADIVFGNDCCVKQAEWLAVAESREWK